MYVLDVQPFLHLISGQDTAVARWSRLLPSQELVFVSVMTIGRAKAAISDLPANDRCVWEDRLSYAISRFGNRVLALNVADAMGWAQLLPMALTTTRHGMTEPVPVDSSALIPAAQAMARRFKLVDRERPYLSRLRTERGLEHIDPYS